MIATSVSVSLYEAWLVDSVGNVLLMFSTLFGCYNPSPHYFAVLYELYLIFARRFLHLLLLAARRSHSDDWVKHISLSIPEYH